MADKVKYRLIPDANGNWNIAERHVAGKDAKEPGLETWTSIKFYGSLLQAANALLGYIINDNWDTEVTNDNLKQLIKVINGARVETAVAVVEAQNERGE